MSSVIDENTQFIDPLTSTPIVNGYIYIGANGLDAELNAITIYSDRDLTTPLSNPQRTDSSGRSVNKIWVPGRYSMKITDSAGVQKLNDLDLGELQATGTTKLSYVQGSDTITAEGSPTITTLTDGQLYVFTANLANTGAVTLQIDSTTAYPIKKYHDIALAGNDFEANQQIVVSWNSTDSVFELQGSTAKNIDQDIADNSQGIADNSIIANQFRPHEAATPNMTVIIDAGSLMIGITHTVKAQQTTSTITAPVTNPRIDRIAIDSTTGLYVIIAGTEAASPVAPSYSVNHYPVCQIALATSTTQITNSLITDERLLLQSKPFRGALVYRTTAQSIPNATYTHVNFDNEDYDTNSIHDNVTNNQRLTVPTGVTQIKLFCSIAFINNATGYRNIAISKNDETGSPSGLPGLPQSQVNAVSGAGTIASISSPVISVIGGDYFTVCVYQNSTVALDIDTSNGYENYFAMEIIQ